jgi:hypothetical protein
MNSRTTVQAQVQRDPTLFPLWLNHRMWVYTVCLWALSPFQLTQVECLKRVPSRQEQKPTFETDGPGQSRTSSGAQYNKSLSLIQFDAVHP